jgi:hypothetical protein
MIYKIRKRTGRRLTLAIYKLRYGSPDYVFSFKGGLGDELMCTIPLKHLAASGKKVWFVTNHADLFENNPDVALVLSEEQAKKFKIKVTNLFYIAPPVDGKEIVPQHHIIKLLCNKVGITGASVMLQPILKLTGSEISKGDYSKNCIVISTSGMSARHPMITKDWFIESYQAVVTTLINRYKFIQVGSIADPLLDGVVDMRGKLKIRETAAVLKNASLYIGQVGFLMHLAKAVNCLSVIIYGGREKPWQSGYSCNNNLFVDLECSPCWSYSCHIDRECMKQITPEKVIAAVESLLQIPKVIKEEMLMV